jgi:micrococcal nuclease
MYEYKAKLIKVVDGDTVDAFIDLGFEIWTEKRIRLYGIDAPETRTRDLNEKKQGIQTKEKLIELLENNDNKFTLRSHGVGKYGRCLGTIIINDIDINKFLIENGFAKEYIL